MSKFVSDAEESKDIVAQLLKPKSESKKLAANTLGSLVRKKMKELKADQSGEYIDKMGRHFELSAEGDGYTVKYGGGKTLAVHTEQACKLTAHCRKLEAAERKELAALADVEVGDNVEVLVDLRDGQLKRGSGGKVVDAGGVNFCDIMVAGKRYTVNKNQIRKLS